MRLVRAGIAQMERISGTGGTRGGSGSPLVSRNSGPAVGDGGESGGKPMGDAPVRFREVRPNGRRQFDLLADRVIVHSRSARVDSEITIMLADLRPEPNRLLVRPKEFALGLLILIASIPLAFIGFVVRESAAIRNEKYLMWFAFAGAILFVSLVILSKTSRKIPFTQFVSHNGHPLLDVARAGPQRADYDAFLETLIDRIRANQKGGRSIPPKPWHDIDE
jgi:hypothetical protein